MGLSKLVRIAIVEAQVVVVIMLVVMQPPANSRLVQSVTQATKTVAPQNVRLLAMELSAELVLEFAIPRRLVVDHLLLAPLIRPLLMEPPVDRLSLVHPGNAHLATFSAKPSWALIHKEMTHTPAQTLGVKFPAPLLNSGVTSAIPCSKISSTVLPVKEVGSVIMVLVKALQLAKKSLPGLNKIRIW
jgi:hypothetical protein